MFLAERRISLFWIVPGQTRMSTSLQSLPGRVLESPRSSTIGSDGWRLSSIAPPNSYLAGRSTDRAPVAALRPEMNFLMPLSVGLEIQIHGSVRLGRRARDSRNSLGIGEPYWFWTVWSRSKIHLLHKKGSYGTRPFRRYCESLLVSI